MKTKKHNIWHILSIAVFITLALCFTLVNMNHKASSVIVSSQHGFEIQINNQIMEIACKYHGIKYDAIRWDTINRSFVFYRDENACYVFTSAFKDYLDKNMNEILKKN